MGSNTVLRQVWPEERVQQFFAEMVATGLWEVAEQTGEVPLRWRMTKEGKRIPSPLKAQ
jgi:hypothetical protein